MAEEFDTSELAEQHIAELPTVDHFHNIHQVKLEEALDGLSAKLFKNPEDLPQKSKYKCSKLKSKDKDKGSTVFSMQYCVKYTMCQRIIQQNISTANCHQSL